MGVHWDVYLDDVLITARSAELAERATRAAAQTLREAGFIISPKSQLTASTAIEFLGKHIDSVRRTITNSTDMLATTMRLWVRGVGTGRMSGREMAKMLGRLQWVARPMGGSSPFVAGAYATMRAGSPFFTRTLIRATAMVLLLSFPSHCLHLPSHTRSHAFFCDAAECGSRFRVGVVGSPGLYRSYLCPQWVHSLQQAELYGAYSALKVAVGCRLHSVVIGIDNDPVRQQLVSLRASTGCPQQLRILRRIFWLRVWSGLHAAAFRVPSALNPADPLSRLHQLNSRALAIHLCEQRRVAWGESDSPYSEFQQPVPTPRFW